MYDYLNKEVKNNSRTNQTNKTQTIFSQENLITGQIKDTRIRILEQEALITIKVVEGNGKVLLLEKDW